MTVSNTTCRWDYVGDGTTVSFPFNNIIFAAGDLNVYRSGTLQQLDSAYQVTGIGQESGGAVVFNAPPAPDAAIVLFSAITAIQGTHYARATPFPSTSTEEALDRAVRLVQQLAAEAGLALQFPRLEPHTINHTLPDAATRANQMVSFDAQGDVIVAQPASALVSLAMQPVVAAATIHDAQALLDVAHIATTEVRLICPTSVRLPNPGLSIITGTFIVDSLTVADGDRLLMIAQASPIDNGIWEYVLATNTLIRPSDYDFGATVSQLFYVQSTDGTVYFGQTWQMADPNIAVIGVDPTIWANVDTGNGIQESGAVIAGPRLPNAQPGPGTPRRLVSGDVPLYRVSDQYTAFPQSPYMNFNRFGYLSAYRQPSSPWKMRAAFNQMLIEHNTVIVDIPVYLEAQITVPLSNKRIILLPSGSGPGAPGAKFLVVNPATSVMVWDFVEDLTIEGELYIEYIQRATVATKAIKSSTGPVSRIKTGRIFTTGVDFAVWLSTTVNGLSIDEIGVANAATDTPIFINAANYALGTWIGRVTNLPAAQTVTPTVNTTFIPWSNSRFINLAGTLAANRTATLSVQNATDGYEFTFKKTSADAFTWSIGGLATLSTGQAARVRFDATAGTWFLAS